MRCTLIEYVAPILNALRGRQRARRYAFGEPNHSTCV